MAQIPWLVVDDVLISPFPTRKEGPTASETAAIKAMQRRLMRSRVAVWIDPQDGRLTPQEIASGVLTAKAGAYVTVRLPHRIVSDAQRADLQGRIARPPTMTRMADFQQ